MPTLTQKANNAFTHQPTPPGTLALEGPGMKIEFSDVVRTSLHHADLVQLGDQDHSSIALNRLLNDRQTLIAAAEGGARHVFAEWPQTQQKHFDDLIEGRIDKTEFATRMIKDNNRPDDDYNRDFLNAEGGAAITARRLGMEFHAADPRIGDDKGAVYYQAFEQLEARRNQMSPEELRAAQDQLRAHEAAFYKARLDDAPLASFVDQKLSSGKGVMIYGGEHGSQRQDFNEYLQASSVKIDTYPDRSTYDKIQAVRHARNTLMDLPVGHDHPELIYIADEKRVYTTPETPPTLAREIETLVNHEAAPTSAPTSTPEATRPEQDQPQQRNNVHALTM